MATELEVLTENYAVGETPYVRSLLKAAMLDAYDLGRESGLDAAAGVS
jgi:hypothetical protein